VNVIWNPDIESAPDALIITDSTDLILRMNEKARDLTGFNGDHALTNAERSQLSQQPEVFLFPELSRPVLGTRYLQLKDETGQSGYLWLFRAVEDKPPEGMRNPEFYRALFAKSIEINRELISVNDNLKKAQARMIQQERLASIGQLAAGVAHELNNPIGFVSSNFASLRGYVKTLLEYLALLRASDTRDNASAIAEFEKKRKIDFILGDLDELFDDSESGVERITRIVQSLRKFSRVDYEDEAQPYDLNDGIRNTLVVANNELKYVTEVETDFGDIPQIVGHGGAINQVLLNLIINAAQAIQEQHRTKKGHIHITTRLEGEMVYCVIADDGPGIPHAIQSRIYDPFFTTKAVGRGTGLGLNISYDIIVNQHGGEIRLDSHPGLGTRFTIGFPVSGHTRTENA
jgi:signal transduction histidine kinase